MLRTFFGYQPVFFYTKIRENNVFENILPFNFLKNNLLLLVIYYYFFIILKRNLGKSICLFIRDGSFKSR